MEKMNPEVKAAWLEALRSGEYKQGKSQLKTNDGSYCCLGVLCDISKLGEWVRGGYHVNDMDYASAFLPEAVKEWAGINSEDPSYGNGIEDHLSYRNDKGMTFAEIADIIEQNF